MSLDLNEVKAAQARVYAEVSVYEKGDAALGFLDSGVVDDLVTEVERLRHVLETHEAQYRRHRDDGYRLSAKHERERDEARAEVERLREEVALLRDASLRYERSKRRGNYDRIGVDADGYAWRVSGDMWSMVRTTTANGPIPEPVTWYVPELDRDGWRDLFHQAKRANREARAALDRVRAVWQPHLDAVPLGLPCQCVGCQMGRAIDGVQPPHDGDETAGQDRRTTIDAITHDPCCSSHGKALTCAQYRRTHFVEVRPCCAHDARALDGAS